MNKFVDLVQGQLDAYNNFDLNSFCSFYHPEILVRGLTDEKIICEGMINFRTKYEQLFITFPNQKCILKSRIITKDTIVDEELILNRPTHPDGLQAVAIYGFRNDLIDRVWFC